MAIHNLKNKLLSFPVLILLLLSYTPILYAQFYSFATKNLRIIYYSKEHKYVVPHLARCFENSFRFHQNLFHYTSKEKITILLHDFNDYGHGGTSTMPWNFISLGIEPFDYVYQTQPTNERMNWLMHHELVHVVTIDKASSSDNFFRSLFFGKVMPTEKNPITMLYSYLTNPRWYCPRWYHEGIAVFLETWMAGGLGRALGGYDEMVFRTMVRDSSYFYDIVGLESEGTTIDFQIGANSYLYGTRFVSYLAYKFGPEKIIKWFNRTKNSKRYFTSQFKKVFGTSLDDEWSQWIKWEHQWQHANLDSIRLYPTTQYRPIIKSALGSVSRAYYDSTRRKLYTAINYPGQLAHIAAISIDDGTIEKICNVPTPALYYVAFLAYDPSSQSLFYTTDNSHGWRDLNIVDLNTGKSKILLKDTRTGDLVFNLIDKSIWGIQHHNGISTIVRFPNPYKGWQNILALPYGKDIFDLDISPDGKYLTASLIEISGRQRLIKMEINKLLHGDSSFNILYEFKNNSPANFVFSPEGRYLYGTSYYTGVSNVWRYDFKKKKMDVITNCETGFFRPVPFTKDSLIVFHYTGKGFIPGVIPIKPLYNVRAVKYLGQAIVENHPIVKSWIAGSPASINIDSLKIYSGKYHPLQNIKLASAYPIIEGYKNFAAIGVQLNLSDPLALHQLNITASYIPTNNLKESEKLHLALKYSYWPWQFTATYNRADFYDLFGPTMTSRKGYSLGLSFNNYLINDKPKVLKYSIDVAGYGNLERLPDFQNVIASFDKFLTLRAKLDYSYLLRSLGAVEYEQGFKLQLISRTNYVNSKIYPRFYTNFDYGFLLPIHHSSIWFRTSIGYSHGNKDEPFANFYFGGFGNNWIDYQERDRYREYYSFPGVKLNQISGTNYGKLLIEWTLPPIRFRKFGIPSFYFRWMRFAFFSSGIVTNLDDEQYKQSFLNFGSQIDIRLVTLSHLRSTLSLGYGIAINNNEKISKELMFSLKIL